MGFFYISDDVTAIGATNGDEPVVLVAGGELDYHASPSLSERFSDHLNTDRRRLVLDISTVTFIDSTAIGVLMGAAVRLQDAGGGSLTIVCAEDNHRVLRILDIAGVNSMITLHSSCEEALSSLAMAG